MLRNRTRILAGLATLAVVVPAALLLLRHPQPAIAMEVISQRDQRFNPDSVIHQSRAGDHHRQR